MKANVDSVLVKCMVVLGCVYVITTKLLPILMAVLLVWMLIHLAKQVGIVVAQRKDRRDYYIKPPVDRRFPRV